MVSVKGVNVHTNLRAWAKSEYRNVRATGRTPLSLCSKSFSVMAMGKPALWAAVVAIFFVCGEARRFQNIPGIVDVGGGLAPVYARELDQAVKADRNGKTNGRAHFSS